MLGFSLLFLLPLRSVVGRFRSVLHIREECVARLLFDVGYRHHLSCCTALVLKPETYTLQLACRAGAYPLAAITPLRTKNNFVVVGWYGTRLTQTLIIVGVAITLIEVGACNHVERVSAHILIS